MSVQEIQKDAERRMAKSLEALHLNFNKVRTGRPHPSLLDGIHVDYYGADTPLNQLAGISVEDGRNLVVAPWEKNLLPAIETAIRNSELGLNPTASGDVVRIPMPPLTEETRRDFVRQVRHEAETARVSVRNIRRDANHALKALIKSKELGEDEEHRAEDQIQKITDRSIAEIDQVLTEKEAELMEV